MSQARDEAAVIDVLAVLFDLVEVDALPPWLVAGAAGVDVAELAGLVPADHPAVRRRDDGWITADGAFRSGDVEVGRQADVVRRAARRAVDVLRGVAESLRPPGDRPDVVRDAAGGRRWLDEHRACLLGVADAAVPAGEPALASSITSLLLGVVDAAGFDAGFVKALTEARVRAAVAERTPERLAGVFRSAWLWFERRGDLEAAEEYAAREWDLWRRMSRLPEAVSLLWWRAGLARRRGRRDLELRCYERLESLYDSAAAEDRAALVRVRIATAAALVDYDRADLAVEWARRAEHAVRALSDFPPVEQALVLEWSGRALWASGAVGPARRRFSDALALLVDVDDDAADHVRRLLAHDQSGPLPRAVPDRYPAPVPPPSPSA